MSRPPSFDESHTHRPTLSIDWEVYAAMLEDSDMPLDQQRELIETLWSIVVMFVDMGFDLDPVAQICGEDALPDEEMLTDIVDLMNTQMGTHPDTQEDV